jgi:hypothetical protein
MQLPERFKSLLSPLNLHLAGALLMLALNVYFIVQIAISIGVKHNNSGNALAEQHLRLAEAATNAQPLRGLDKKIDNATSDAASFESSRVPMVQSDVISELGALADRSKVRLARVQYAPLPPDNGLTEFDMDASLSGDYRPLVQFINSIERDKIFMVIDGVTLSGQQGGTVTLKIRITAWLRPGSGGKTTSLLSSAKEGQ